VTEDGAFRRTAAGLGSSSEDVYIGLRRRRVVTDDSRSRSRSRFRAAGSLGGEAPRFEFRTETGESSRLGSKRGGGEASRLIETRDGESARLIDMRGSGEFSRC
jgi:hypothetical protein